MTRLEKLRECLLIAREHKNPYMEANIMEELKHELENPSTDVYPDATDEKESA